MEVDIAFIGAGFGGMANAIATVDAGGEVLVATAPPARVDDVAHGTLRERVHPTRGWLAQETVDTATNEYFAALLDGVATRADRLTDTLVPVRTARNLTTDEAYGAVEPFIGSRLADWASQCVTSPYGMLYTSMRDWRSTAMRSSDGESIEVYRVGALEWSDGCGSQTLSYWISEQARQRDIDVVTNSALQRVVFEDDDIVGVVLSTPNGPLAVRTRAGITFSAPDQDSALDASADYASGDRLQVCLVGRSASRFGRVELMATEPVAPPRPTCTGSRRQYREGLHDSRQAPLEGWRCGKVHGYPPADQ